MTDGRVGVPVGGKRNIATSESREELGSHSAFWGQGSPWPNGFPPACLSKVWPPLWRRVSSTEQETLHPNHSNLQAEEAAGSSSSPAWGLFKSQPWIHQDGQTSSNEQNHNLLKLLTLFYSVTLLVTKPVLFQRFLGNTCTHCVRGCFLHPDTADRMLASLTRTVWTKLMVPDETAYNIAVDTAGQHAKATDKKKFQEQNLYPKNNLVTQLFCCRWCNLSSKSVLITFVHLNAWYGFLIFFVIRNC